MKRVACVLALLFCALHAQANAGEKHAWKSESNLEVIFNRKEPEVRQAERRVHFVREGYRVGQVRYLIIETEMNTLYMWGEKGTEGKVSVTAWRLQGASKNQEKAYAFTCDGIGINVQPDFITVEEDGDLAYSHTQTYFTKNGKFAFSAFGPPAEMILTPVGVVEERVAAFSPFSQRIPDENRTKAIGVIAYATRDRLLAEALLVSNDESQARSLSMAADESQKLTWIDLLTNQAPGRLGATRSTNFDEVAMRLRFHDSKLDLFIPVTATDIDYARLKLPPGLSLTPLKPAE
ncbi:MAG: hypothetical protein HQL45_11100 [Alphaproteobacteria bacterium]|nr:hypothetical protein [Alphaproteobacteria bacterium]